MKKLFALFLIVAAGSTFAADRTGKLALGFQESFTSFGDGAGGTATSPFGAWSVKYGLSDKANLQATVGFAIGDTTDESASFGLRFLYDLIDNENSDFYTGLGVLYVINENVTGPDAPIRFNVPLGFEFSFAGLPEIGFSAEAGLMIDLFNNEDLVINSVGGNVGGALGLGVHYYF